MEEVERISMDFDVIITGIRKAIYGREVREYIASSMEWTRDFVNQSITNIKELLRQAEAARDAAKASQDAAKVSETNAKASEDAAKASQNAAASSASAAAGSASAAKASETNAKASEDAAKTSAGNAKASETNAKASENAAKTSETNAKTSETNAKASADSMGTSVATCTAKAKEAEASAGKAAASEKNAKTSEGNAKASEDEARQLVEAAKKVVNTDKTLTIDGAPADAKTVGDKLKSIFERIKSIKTDWNSVTDKPETFPPSAHNHSKLEFENKNEVNFVGIPENNTVYWGYRDNTIDEYRFNDGRGSGAFANVRAKKFIGSLDGNAETSTKTTGITDYNSSSRTIQVGYAGDGLNTSNLTHIAGYTDDGTKIKNVSKGVLKSWLGVTNITSQTSDPGAGSSLATGSILLVYV